MKIEKNWHKLVLIIAGIMAIVSWALAYYYWAKLPNVIPTHFGFNGQADAWGNKSFWLVFLIPMIQTAFLAGFSFLYVKPQYSDMPTTLLLMAMDEKKREHAFSLIRTMIVVVLLFLSILFSYMTYVINVASLNPESGFQPWWMLGIIGAMLVWLIWYTVKVYRVTMELLKEKK